MGEVSVDQGGDDVQRWELQTTRRAWQRAHPLWLVNLLTGISRRREETHILNFPELPPTVRKPFFEGHGFAFHSISEFKGEFN